MRHIEGTVDILGVPTNYTVLADVDTDGRSTRDLVFERDGFVPQETFGLMRSIAPVDSNDVGDVVRDIRIATEPAARSTSEFGARVSAAHRAAFKDIWRDVIVPQAPTLAAHMPFSTEDTMLSYGNPSQTALLKKMTDPTARSLAYDKLRGSIPIAAEFQIEGTNLRLPPTELVSVPDSNGVPTYFGSRNFDVNHDGLVAAELRRVSDTGYALTCQTRHQKHTSTPIWKSLREGKHEVTPVAGWHVKDGRAVFEHTLPRTNISEDGTERHDDSSLIGAVLMAHLTPEVTEGWPKLAGYPAQDGRVNRGPQQAMGPLQATLLAVMDSPRIMAGPFVAAIEKRLEDM